MKKRGVIETNEIHEYYVLNLTLSFYFLSLGEENEKKNHYKFVFFHQLMMLAAEH